MHGSSIKAGVSQAEENQINKSKQVTQQQQLQQQALHQQQAFQQQQKQQQQQQATQQQQLQQQALHQQQFFQQQQKQQQQNIQQQLVQNQLNTQQQQIQLQPHPPSMQHPPNQVQPSQHHQQLSRHPQQQPTGHQPPQQQFQHQHQRPQPQTQLPQHQHQMGQASDKSALDKRDRDVIEEIERRSQSNQGRADLRRPNKRKRWHKGKHLTVILSDSIISLRSNRFHKLLDTRREQCIVSRHPGATSDQLEHLVEYWAKAVNPERIIICCGINNMIHYPQDAQDTLYEVNTAADIIKVAKKAKDAGIRDVCMLGLLDVNYRDENNCHIDTTEVNKLLKDRCSKLNFRFIDNSNIKRRMLWDGLHPSKDVGQEILRKNILKCFSTFRF